MPAFETMDRKQMILYWEFLRADGQNESVFADPIELMVRWVEQERLVNTAQGQPVASSITVVLGRAIVIGSLMWLAPEQGRGSKSAIDQWYGDSGSATNDENVMEVVATPVTPSLKREWTRWTANLGFYRRKVVSEN
jgi:hypothetical protein